MYLSKSRRFSRSGKTHASPVQFRLNAAVIESLEQRAYFSILAAPITYKVGGSPSSVALGDINGDGKLDLVTTNYNGSVTIRAGNGDGTFRTAKTLSDGLGDATGKGTFPVEVADFDGKPYIFVSSSSKQFSVIPGNGDGTFDAARPFAAPEVIYTATIADVNGDGIPDIITAGANGKISVFLGDSKGTFGSPETMKLGPNAIESLAVADFNDDNKLDLVVGDTSGAIQVLIGNGDGTFQKPLRVYSAGYIAAVGDINSDGNADVLLGEKNGRFATLLGNGDGTFKAPRIFTTDATVFSTTLADINGDGKPDLVLDERTTGKIGVAIANGNGTFKPATLYSVGGSPDAIAAGNLSGDGESGLVIANSSNDFVSVLQNTGKPIPVINRIGNKIAAVGTAGADTGAVSVANDKVVLTVDAITERFVPTPANPITISLGDGDDSLSIAAGVPAAKVISGDGSDTIRSLNTAADTLNAGAGSSLVVGGGARSLLKGGAGRDLIEPTNNLETVAGGAGSDTVITNSSADSIHGGAGINFFLDANATKSTIVGGPGLNFAEYNPSDVHENIFEVIDPPPPGTDDAPAIAGGQSLAPAVAASATAALSGGLLTIKGISVNDNITLALVSGTKIRVVDNKVSLGAFLLSAATKISISGGNGNDSIAISPLITLPATVAGAAGNDTLVAGGGATDLIGGSGSDSLVGGSNQTDLIPDLNSFTSAASGNDTLDGGTGYSIADFSHRTDPLTLSNNGDSNSGGVGETSQINSNVSVIFGGTSNDTITGKIASEFISGGYGANLIHGGGADDILTGGTGNDSVAVAAEPVTLTLNNGFPNQYEGVSDPAEDILDLGPMDILVSSFS